MISDLMLYGTKVALLVSVAALAVERIAVWRGFSRRALWAAALVISLGFPVVGLLMAKPATEVRTPVADLSSWLSAEPRVVMRESQATPQESAVAKTSAAETTRSESQRVQPQPIGRLRAIVEQVLLLAWLAVSLGLAAVYTLAWLRLRRAARYWQHATVDDQEVCVTDALGPAVFGFIKPVVLIPKWVLDAPRPTRALVLAHEQEHIGARDPALLALGLVLVVIAPWNLLLWWQLRRLRFAIEVDCDARVLRRGADVTAYGEVLLAVGERRTSTPVGAIALIEPASQLLQRIRIMTGGLPRRGKWAAAGALGFSLASLAVAAEFRAPLLHADSVSRELSDGALRKLPLGEDPRPAQVRSLVQATYSDLFAASSRSGPVLVTLLLHQDGTLYKSFRETIEPTPWIANSLRAFAATGVDYEHRGSAVKLRMWGGPAAQNQVDVRAWYMRQPDDPTRDVATVSRQVRARYASLFAPVHADGSRRVREGANLLTVFMTESGDIERAKVQASTNADVDVEALATAERFVAIGVPRERVGLVGATELYVGRSTDDSDLKSLQVVYAWPRRPNESEWQRERLEQADIAGVNDDPKVNRAIAEHYFPDLYTYPKEWPRADPWVLLNRQGKVLATGRRVVMSTRDIQLYVESAYPGIRTEGVQVTTIKGHSGQSDVGFVWLAADSPVTDLTKVDLAGRNATLMYADVVGEGMTRPTELLSLKVGSPAVMVCSLENPFGVVHVQVTAVEAAADAVTVRVRLQHASLGPTGEIPKALDTAWSPESALVRAPYGAAASVQVVDQSGKSWKVVLHPERLGAATVASGDGLRHRLTLVNNPR